VTRRRDRIVLLIAIFKLAKAITLIAAGIGAFRLLDPAVAERVERWLAQVQLAPGRRIIAFLSRADDRKIEALGSLAFAYAILFLVEGTGLLMRKRWAEWFTIIITGSLLPFEIYEIFKGVSVAKAATVVVNAAVVIYLVIRVRKRA
jgi:uncharacterized membrane protein (DUF2068 family)